MEARAYFSAAEIERATASAPASCWLFGARTAVELGVLVAASCAARRGCAARRARAGRRRGRGGALARRSAVATLPLRAVARERAKDVGLVTQRWAGWAGDVAKAQAIGGVLRGRRRRAAGGRDAALRAALVGRRAPRSWSASASSSPTPAPVVLDPLFNQFTPLPGRASCAPTCSTSPRRAGVDVGQVYEVDASRRTTAANAYVTGLGHTKRVVLYDTC